MHNIALTWQQAAVLAALLTVAAVSASRLTGRRLGAMTPFVRETALIVWLYSLWQLAGTLSVLGTSGAFRRADDLESIERGLHLPSEASVQNLVVHHPLLAQACNLYYATMHFGVLFVFLLWLFIRHRDAYPRIRTSLALLTLVCLLVQLVPVAPPRLLPGYIDTARQYGQSVYGLGIAADQLGAMPSVHVGWAVLIAWAVVTIGTSRWRWIAVAHAVLTVFVVAATANHFWLDGAVAVVILVACVYAQRGVARLRRAPQPADAELAAVG